MPFSDDEVFELTKIIYKEVFQNFTQNYIGQKDPLQQFQENYIQPLYPSKKIQQTSPFQNKQQTKHKFFQYHHKYDRQIEQQFKNQSQQNSTSTQQSEEENKFSYISAIQRYSITDLVCKLRVGRFFCWKSTPPDNVYQDLGLGVCLYFKFMKHLVCVLIILTVLSAITMSIFYSVALSNKYKPGLNYQKILFSLGVGSLSLQGIKCIHQNITKSAIQFDLACPIGSVRVLGPVYTQSQFQTLQTCKTDITSFMDQTQNLYISKSQYLHQTNCDQKLSNCTYNLTVSNPRNNYDQISVTYECINGVNIYGVANITRNAALYVAVIFDLLLIISLMIFYWSQSAAENTQQKYFKEKQILLSAFTLQVGTFSKRNFNSQFNQFLNDIQQQIKKQDNLQLNLKKCIVQIRLPDNDQYDNDQQKRQKSYQRLYNFIGQRFIAKQIDPQRYIDGQDFKNSVFSSQNNFKSYRRKLGSLIKQYRRVQKLKGKNHDQQLKVYIVFLKPKYKRLILQKNRIILGKQIIQTQHKDYQIHDPPAPSLVLWDNIGKNKLLRGIISWFISLIILLGTYILTAYILSLQNQTVVGQYDFNIECQNVFLDQNYSQFNQQYYQQYKLSYTHCYCLSRSIIFSLNFQSVCTQWRDQYTLFLAIPILYGMGLFILNQFVSWIYRMLSAFQAHQYLTSELYSYIIKKTILQTTDLALIVILLSINFNKKSTAFDFLLIGSYDDVSADWHLQVGIIIIVNMFFNIFSPLIQGLFYLGERLSAKIKLFFFNTKYIYQKTKINYIQHYRQNVFPLQERYSSILTVVFICLALNFIYPIMTVILTITLLLYLLIDKLMIIKAYQKPVNFEGLLQKKIMKIFLIALLMHLLVSAIFITQPFLVVAGSTSGQASITGQRYSRVGSMFKVGYVMPYMILTFIMLISLSIIYASNQYLRTKPNPRIRIGIGGIPFQENKYYNLLDAYELDRTIALKRRQIQRNKILQKKYMKKYSPQQEQQLRQSYSNKPIIPTRKKDLILNKNKSILSQISEYSYYRLLKKKVKTSKQQNKLVKLAGMTAYQWEQDWIYFDQEVRLDYKIPQIDSYLNKISQQATFRIQLIQGILQMARTKQRMEGVAQKQIQSNQEFIQQKQFKQIMQQSNVTSLLQTEQQNQIQIQTTFLPILQLQRKIEQMERQKSKQRSKSRSDRNSMRGSSREFMCINLKTGKNPQNQNKELSESQSQNKNIHRISNKLCTDKVQFSKQLKQIDENDIQINIQIASDNSNFYRKNNNFDSIENMSNNNKLRRQMKKQQGQQQQFKNGGYQGQKQQLNIRNKQQEQRIQQIIQRNSSQQEDDTIQKQLFPVFTEKQTSINNQHAQIGVKMYKTNLSEFPSQKSEFPSQKILVQKENSSQPKRSSK